MAGPTTGDADGGDGRSPELDVISPQSRTRTVIGGLVSLLAIGGCVYWALGQDKPRFPSGAANAALLGVGVGVYAIATFLRGARWDAILRFLRIEHARADAFALTAVGYMGNTVLPARGGEVLRIFLMAERSTARRREVLGSIVTERLLDLAALGVLLVGIGLSGVVDPPGGDLTTALVTAALVGGLMAAVVYLRLRVAGRLEQFAARIRPLVRASRVIMTPVGLMLLGATLATWVSEGLIFWLIAEALDVGLSPTEGLAVVVLASLSALIPAGPGYVGTYDAAALFALAQLDVRGGTALSCVLLFRFVVFVPITLVGLLLLVSRYRGSRDVLRRPESAPSGQPVHR